MTNLLNETKQAIEASGHTPSDIIFIGSVDSGHACTWEEFTTLANFSYDSGFGGQEVASDLRIYFADGGSMWRGEYDGSEWWEHGTPFVAPEATYPITRLTGGVSWATVEDMCKPGGKYGLDEDDDV